MTRLKNRLLVLFCMILVAANIQAETDKPVHGFAMHGEAMYGPDFQHFDYVNPDAPKGGEARFAAIGSFDTLNPFVIKGESATGLGFLFQTLMTDSADEAFTEYGLIAETITVPEDRSYVEFSLRPQARFNDGTPITADDVIFSFETLRDHGQPFFRFYYANVTGVEKLGERQVKFFFTPGENQELPLIIGQLPILSKAYWQSRDFESTTLEAPLGNGPYRIERFEPGRFIIYRRNPDYWGKDLPVNRGLYNFERIRYDYYRDSTVALEAFKAGAYDIRPENTAKLWATGYDFPAAKQGLVQKAEFHHQMPSGMQAFVFNLRHSLFQDIRVREALAYAFDFEWSNRNLFYNQYTRTQSYFDNSELAATGLPSAAELKILEPLRAQIPEQVFSQTYSPPKAENAEQLRANLRKALTLLQQAGWTFKDRKLVNADTDEPFQFEILLVQPAFERIVLPFTRNLERLGIQASVRTVDSAQYENRVKAFDFDMLVFNWGQSLSPGNEQRNFWGSAAAEQSGSRNVIGIKNPAIDQLIDQVIAAPDRENLITRTRALDRVLLWNHFVIPHWHLPYARVAYWNKFGYPDKVPMQGVQLLSWWIDAEKQTALEQKKPSLKGN